MKKKIARIISELSNGFATMILTPVIPILASSVLFESKLLYSFAYLLVPAIPYLIMRRLGKISDYEFSKREERPPYFVTLSVLFGVVFLFVRTLGDDVLTSVSLNVFVVTTVFTLVTFFWKISGHMTYSTTLFITLAYLFPSFWILFLFLFSPLIGWSRIVLEKHTLTQVSVGILLTLTISILIYWGF